MFFLDNNLEKIKEKILEKGIAELVDIELTDNKAKIFFADTTVLEIEYVEHEGLDIKAYQD